jgi:hypothetical protein
MVSTRDIDIIQPNQNSPPSKVKLIIRNQFSGIELVSPVYCSENAECYLPPNQRVYADSATQVGFNIDPDQESIGVLIYKLQRKDINELNEEAIYSEDEATSTQIFMVWKVKNSRELYVYSRLIEHDKDHIWNRDRLMKLAKSYELFNIQHGPIKETWLMHDNTVLMTGLNMTHEKECYKLEITISSKNDVQRPQHIDLNR